MATITQILGTDSLSSSRIVLNDNFTAINDQLEDVAGLLDVDTQTLTIAGSLNASSISLTDNKFIVNSSAITLGLETIVQNTLILEGGLAHSVTSSEVASMPTTGYDFDTYKLAADDITISNADRIGQEITLFAAAGNTNITNAGTNIAGVTSVFINENGTLTLRYIDTDLWCIISSFNCTIA